MKNSILILAAILIFFSFINNNQLRAESKTKSKTETPEQKLNRIRKLQRTDKAKANKLLQELIVELQKAVKKNPDKAKNYLNLGYAYFYLHKDQEALRAYKRAIAKNPNYSECYFMIAVIHRFNGNFAEAEKNLLKAGKLTPKRADIWFELGFAQSRLKKNSEALKAYKKCLELNPKYGAAAYYAAVLLLNKKKTKEALKYFIQSSKAYPDAPNTHYNIGQIYQNLNEYRKALISFQQVVKLSPQDWSARAKLVQLYEALKQYDNRDKQRKELFSFHKKGKIKNPYYCRDQFFVGKIKVMAYEFFALKGERAVKYRFYVLDANQNVDYVLSLGSYKSTNQVAKELGRLKPGQRLYHLDKYSKNGANHWTYGFYNQAPSYNKLKETISLIILDKAKPVSSTLTK